jgi:hypothetical protein
MTLLVSLLIVFEGVFMGSPPAPTDRADQIFRTGPEELVASSSTIVTGTVSGYSREVQKSSAPNVGGLPIEWTAHAQIDRPIPLKGKPPAAPIHFSRHELSFMAPTNATGPIWEMDFGELKPDGQAVLFFSEGPEPRVVPTGEGATDLVTLVKEIVRIQAMPDPGMQREAWLQYLANGPSAEGCRVALRSLVRAGAEWSQIETGVASLPPNADLRAFAFAFVAFHVAAETWGKDPERPVDFLCRTFSAERDVEQQLRALQSFKLLLRDAAQPLRGRLLACLQAWQSRGLSDPQLIHEYQQIQTQY